MKNSHEGVAAAIMVSLGYSLCLTLPMMCYDARVIHQRTYLSTSLFAAVQAGEVARAMAFHDSEITALQGWAGGAPAVERPQPAPTRSQVMHSAAHVWQPSSHAFVAARAALCHTSC